jgi:hypothetical protein
MTTDELATLELQIAEQPQLVVPLTGELVDLRDPLQVAEALQAVRELKYQLDGARVVLEQVLRLEASRMGTKTLHMEGLTAVITGGETVEYDGERLGWLLEQAGMPPERVSEIVQTIVTYKVNAAKAKAAASANPSYKEAVEKTRSVKETAWRVSIRR